MESWKVVWRRGFKPQISTDGLLALRDALATDDVRLIQRRITIPVHTGLCEDWPVECACAIGFTGWQGGNNLESVGEVEEYFARICYHADALLKEPGGVRWFLNWFDETPREEMRRELFAEVELALANRAAAEAGTLS